MIYGIKITDEAASAYIAAAKSSPADKALFIVVIILIIFNMNETLLY